MRLARPPVFIALSCLCALALGWYLSVRAPREMVTRAPQLVVPETIGCGGVATDIADVAARYQISTADIADLSAYYSLQNADFCALTQQTVDEALSVIAVKRAQGAPILDPSTIVGADGLTAVERRLAVKRARKRPADAIPIDTEAVRQGDLSALQPDKQWLVMRQLSDTGVVVDNGLLTGKAQADALRTRTVARGAGVNPLSWTDIGPGNVGGRVRALVIDPVDTDTMYAGGVSGGLWKTTDGGSSWSHLDDFMGNLGIHSLVMDPSNRSVLYAGTGEEFRGAGIYKTTDSGATWTQLAATATSDFHYVRRLIMWEPGGVSTIVAATDTGLFRSTNGGTSWSLLVAGAYMDVEYDPNNGNNIIAGGNGYTVRSTDGGTSWGMYIGFGLNGRVELAYAPSQSGLIYASVNRNDGELWKSTDGGANWSYVSTAALSQGDYDNTIWVDPTNASNLVWGGTDLYKSTDGGVTVGVYSEWWRWPLSPHADNHLIVAHPGFNGTSNKTIFVTNDGGVWKAADYSIATSRSGWESLNTDLRVTQFYSVAGNALTGRITGGSQDNGTQQYSKYLGAGAWSMVTGGDGGFAAADDSYWYGEYVYLGQLCRATWGGDCNRIDGGRDYFNSSTGQWEVVWKGAPYEITDAKNETANFIAPFILDPNDSTIMLAGGRSLWRSTDVRAALTDTTGPQWKAIKPAVSCSGTYECYMKYISAIAVAPGNSSVVYVGTNGDGSTTYGSTLYKTTNAGAATATWSTIDTGLPNRAITDVVVDKVDTNTVYVVLGGYSDGNVYRTTDGGSSWAVRDGSGADELPDVPVYSMAIHPDNPLWLYVGTELGLFSSEDGGATWQATSDGPVNTAVYDLQWVGKKLIAATYGRGMFTAVAAAPTVEYIQAALGATGTVVYTVAFSEVVTGVDASDFALITTGGASGSIQSVSGSGNVYTVTVAASGATGTIGLALAASPIISDALGNALTDTTIAESALCYTGASLLCPLLVTSTGDSGAGTLRDVVAAAAAGSTVAFAPALEGQTITLTDDIVVAKALTIDGGLMTNSITISGGDTTRLFTASSGGDLTLRRLNLTDGYASQGAAVYVSASGTVTVDRSAVYGNSAAFGGAFMDYGALTIVNSTIYRNDDFYGNTKTTYGSSNGAAIYEDGSATLTVLNSTIAYNRSNYIAVSLSGALTMINSIISNTTNYAGSPVALSDCYSWGTRSVAASIVQDGRCGESIRANPGLGALGLNGGGTRSYAISASSLASAPYNHGDATTCAGAQVGGIDQRGVSRVAPCDIGAYEYSAAVATATKSATPVLTKTPTKLATKTATKLAVKTATKSKTRTKTKTPTKTRTRTRTPTPRR
ncbi:MAG: hypothetical protein RLZZ297_1517 [Chloroflexota bacterium]